MLPIKPICLCGEVLVPANVDECYNNEFSFVICDVCDEQIADATDIYHGPKGKVKNVHPRGYDICIKCARKHARKLQKYHVLIIQTIESRHCNDGKFSVETFKKLNYHSIQLLNMEDATKRRIKKEFLKLHEQSKQGNNVILVCFTGHGGVNHVENSWKFC